MYWSLAVEEHFYLLFPLLYVGMRKGKLIGRDQARVLILAICAAVLVWRCVFVFGLDSSVFRTYYATDTRIDSILFGCIVGRDTATRCSTPCGSPSGCGNVGCCPQASRLLFFCLVYRNPDFRETLRYSLQGIGLYAIFYCAVRYPQWALMRWLNVRWVAFVGTLTYSLYLVHATVLLVLAQRYPEVPSVVRGGVALGISFGLAYLIDRFVELPFGRLRRSLESSRAPASTSPDRGDLRRLLRRWTSATPTPTRRSAPSCAPGSRPDAPELPPAAAPRRLAGPPCLRHRLAAAALRRRLRRDQLARRSTAGGTRRRASS